MSNTDDASQVDANTLMNCISRGGETGMLARAELMRRLSTQPPLPEASGDAELREAFAALANVILSEAPADADNIVLFTDCSEKAHTISMDQLRAAAALSRHEAGGKEDAGEGEDITPEMDRVGFDACEIQPGINGYKTGTDARRAIYRAMRSAALQSLPARPGVTKGDIVRNVLLILRTYPGKVESHDDATARQAKMIADAIMALIGGGK